MMANIHFGTVVPNVMANATKKDEAPIAKKIAGQYDVHRNKKAREDFWWRDVSPSMNRAIMKAVIKAAVQQVVDK